MWRSVGGVLLLTSLSLSGCLSGETLPVVEDVAPVAFMDGDRIDWAFEGTGTFRAVIQPGEHVNLRFRIDHDDIEDWCSFGDDHPLYADGAFTFAALYPTDLDPARGNGAHLVRIGHSEDLQRIATMNMPRDGDCAQSQLIGISSKTSATVVFGTSIAGFRLSVFDQHADTHARFIPTALKTFDAPPAIAPPATADGVLEQSGQRVLWTTEWRASFDVGPSLFVGLQWRDADEGSPGFGVHHGRDAYEDDIRILRNATETVARGGGGGSGSPVDSASIWRAWVHEPGTYDFVWRHTHTAITPISYSEGAWFVAIPLDA